MELGVVSKLFLDDFPQGLRNDPEVRVFNGLPIVSRTEAGTAAARERVLDEDPAAIDEPPDVFFVQ
jgi:hypothetical protein